MERCSLQCLEGMLGEQGLRQKEKTGLEQGPPPPSRGAWLQEPGKVKCARAQQPGDAGAAT